ncbi:hypothetical protein [Sporomusa sp.]|uniref:hypothetical protein n=1 Tax=Sporomusa sp. TaxID=2078658 RepID=UPI002CC271E2|nr:hypothetical protein [Sporomusa sp.]HWR08977.1 hypothetical protein [Sporomusa sp.]
MIGATGKEELGHEAIFSWPNTRSLSSQGWPAGLAGSDGCRLACLVLLDLKHSDFRQRQNTSAGSGFGVVQFQAVVGDDDGPLEADAVGDEIEVYPLQSQQFGAADAGGPFRMNVVSGEELNKYFGKDKTPQQMRACPARKENRKRKVSTSGHFVQKRRVWGKAPTSVL